jgi:hypothetical protein
VYEKSADFRKWAKRLAVQLPSLASGILYGRIELLQPFSSDTAIDSVGVLLSQLMETPAEHVHPLLLLQAYSNTDKHRAIAFPVERSMVTDFSSPLLSQDRSMRRLQVGDRIAHDTPLGEPFMLETNTAVMVERPEPWAASVSPARELELLCTWVRLQAIPILLTGTPQSPLDLPASIDLSDSGRTLRERITEQPSISALDRVKQGLPQSFVDAMRKEPRIPKMVRREFQDGHRG